MKGVSFAAMILLASVSACGGRSSGGRTVTSIASPTSTADSQVAPAVAFDATGAPAVAYVEAGQLQTKSWTGSAWLSLGSGLIVGTNPKGLSLVLDGTTLALAWEDTISGVSAVHAARLSGGTWAMLGSQLNGAGVPANQPFLASGKMGLFAAYVGGSPYTTAVVTHWTGSGWQGFPPTPSQNAVASRLALAADGSPISIWSAPVSQATGVNWQAQTRAWSAGASAWSVLPTVAFRYSPSISLASATDGTLFLLSQDGGGTPSMQRLQSAATGWQDVGLPQGYVLSTAGELIALPAGEVLAPFMSVGSALLATWNGSWATLANVGVAPVALSSSSGGRVVAAWLVAPSSGSPSPLQVATVQ